MKQAGTFDYRPVHLRTLTDDVEVIDQSARVLTDLDGLMKDADDRGKSIAGRYRGGRKPSRRARLVKRFEVYAMILQICGINPPAIGQFRYRSDPLWPDGAGHAHITSGRRCHADFSTPAARGVCGWCNMNIDGSNTLAYTKAIDDAEMEAARLPPAAPAGDRGSEYQYDAFLCQYALIKP